MIRLYPDPKLYKMHVILKDGGAFIDVDTPCPPIIDGVICFWVGDSMRIYPLDAIAYVEMEPRATNATTP